MYDINLKVISKGKITYFIFVIVGTIIMLTFGGVGGYFVYSQAQMDVEVSSTRMEYTEYIDTDGSLMYKPIYFYQVGEQELKCDPKSSQSWKPDEHATIYYSSKNPSKCITNGNTWLGAIFLGFAVLFGGIFNVIGFYFIKKTNKRIEMVKQLNDTGKLVKGIPYRMEKTNLTVNDRPILRPVIDYRLPNGTILTLQGDGRFDRRVGDEDGLVDLVIDESNPDNYFIDFEINRLSGNRSDDYYSIPGQEKKDNDPYTVSYGTYGTFK